MGEVKHAFRLMLIDINEDKVLVDEFCDAVVAGTAQNPEEGKKQEGGNIISFCRCGLSAGMAATIAAEEAIQKHKAMTLASFFEKSGIENVEDLVKAALEGEDLTDGREDS
jgi:hypothetical protein